MSEKNSGLRDIADALLVAGQSVGEAVGKLGGDVTEQLKQAVDNARSTFDGAGDDKELKDAVSSFASDAESIVRNIGDSTEADEAKDALKLVAEEIRDAFGNIDADDAKQRIESVVARVQERVADLGGKK